MKIEYDKEVDAAYIYLEATIKDGEVKETIELNDNIVLDLDEKGKIIGIEILEASSFLRDSILETTQAKILKLKTSYNNQIQRTGENPAADLR